MKTPSVELDITGDQKVRLNLSRMVPKMIRTGFMVEGDSIPCVFSAVQQLGGEELQNLPLVLTQFICFTYLILGYLYQH